MLCEQRGPVLPHMGSVEAPGCQVGSQGPFKGGSVLIPMWSSQPQSRRLIACFAGTVYPDTLSLTKRKRGNDWCEIRYDVICCRDWQCSLATQGALICS